MNTVSFKKETTVTSESLIEYFKGVHIYPCSCHTQAMLHFIVAGTRINTVYGICFQKRRNLFITGCKKWLFNSPLLKYDYRQLL
ncbi:LOW QUALITY PROTEIN: hypothetical protein HZS_725 [Henneguya salminicola]|nr:LOW QUALITY PROTEIN: hypothetical protein HZS_725 [Henneguya salminicola]